MEIKEHYSQLLGTTGVALDMWTAYRNAVEEKLPQADIVHDRFHISQHLNEAVDKVRCQENKALKEAGDRRMAGVRYTWLVNEEQLNEAFAEQFNELKPADLKVSRAWVIRNRLEPIKEKARMIKNHLSNILTCFKHRISNAAAEGLNSKIQTVKANARGCRSFDGFRNSILFYCGDLDMIP